MELKTYLTILARRWQIILLILLVSIGVSLYASRYVSYEAEARLQVITPVGGSFDYIYYETTFANRLMNTYAQIATSNQLKSELKAKLNLAALPNISIKTIPDSEIIQIIVESRDPALAARTANGLAELIISRQDNVVADRANSEEISLLNNRKAELEKSLTTAQQEYDSLVQDYSQTAARIAVLDRTIQVKETTYQNTMTQYQQVLSSGVPGRATVLSDEADHLVKELQSLNQQYEELSTDSNKYSEQILLLRQTIQNDQSAYTSLLFRYDSALSAQLREERTQSILMVSPAVEPSQPVLPPFFIIALGILCGLIGGTMIAFVSDSLDTRIFRAEQVTTLTTTPVLGSFPRYDTEKEQSFTRSGDYQVLRKGLFNGIQDSRPKTILVTSPKPGEGKSTVLAGLALSLVKDKAKVLIIDANLRRPRQHLLHSISDGTDLCAFLADENICIEDVIRKDVKSGVDLIPCLKEVRDPTALLQSRKLSVLFEQTSSYDFILIDTPALLSVPDTYDLIPFVDVAFLVIHRGRTTAENVKATCKYLEASGAKLLGIILNQMPMKVDALYPRSETRWLNHIKINMGRFIPKRL